MILRGRDITADVDRTCDVCIVGSGAGGAVLAEGLCARGLDVVMLEEGGYHTNADFDLQEAHAYPMLYQERGSRATADLAIAILQGRAVGGTTVVNWTTCFRTPERILAHWREKHGLTWTADELDPHWTAIEQRLNIHEWPFELVNANNRKLWDGCDKLGWQKALLHRNVNGCANSGYCSLGCPVNGKQSMLVTYIPDAVDKGLSVYANTRGDRFDVENGRVVAVRGVVLDPETERPNGRTVTIRPKIAVASGGAINTPALLLRSGLDDGKVGKRTFLHPVVAMSALYDEPVDGFFGAPQSVASHHFIDRGDKVGFFLETPPMQPMLSSTAFPVHGQARQDAMAQLRHFGTVIAVAVDGLLPGDEGGTVSLRSDGRIRVDYPIGPALCEAFREGMRASARIELAAGAKEVLSLHLDSCTIRTESDLAALDERPYGALQHSIFTAHQMGGCRAGPDAATSVVDLDLRHHRVQNLFVVDGSVLPTALGVNPSLTIYAIAHWARDKVAAAL